MATATDSPYAARGSAPGAPAPGEALSRGVIFAYSLPRIGLGIMGLLFATYLLKFATDVLYIAPAAMGGVIALARLWDGVSDPLVGYLSDRTRTRYGRRRIWMFASALPIGLTTLMIWSPPNALAGWELIAWMAIALLAYETATTAFLVPHAALGPELTTSYHERTRLYGYSHMIGGLGLVLGVGALELMNSAEDKRTMALWLSAGSALVVAPLVFTSTRALPERPDYQDRGGEKIWRSFFDVLRNPHARVLLLVYTIEAFGSSSIALLLPYLTQYVLPMESQLPILLAVYFLPRLALTPVWIRISRDVGKKALWMAAMIVTFVVFAGLFFVTEAGYAIYVLTFIGGAASGCGEVAAPAIQADVVDYDELETGERKEGAYFATWNFARKAAAGATAIAAGFALDLSGFLPNVEQTETTKLVIRALFGLLPAACYAVGIAFLAGFAFNEAEHAAVRAELDARAGNGRR